MPKKMIDNAESASLVTESFLLRVKDIPLWSERFVRRWRAVMPDRDPPDLPSLLEFLALELRADRVDMVDAAQAHELEIADDHEIRRAVADAVAGLRSRYLDARALYKSIYGRDAAHQMGFRFHTEPTPKGLRRRVGLVLRRFRKLPRRVIPAPRGKEGLGLRPSQIINLLEASHKVLGKAARRLAAEERKARRTRRAKSESYWRHAVRYASHTWCGQGICRVVGLEEEVARFKAAKQQYRQH